MRDRPLWRNVLKGFGQGSVIISRLGRPSHYGSRPQGPGARRCITKAGKQKPKSNHTGLGPKTNYSFSCITRGVSTISIFCQCFQPAELFKSPARSPDENQVQLGSQGLAFVTFVASVIRKTP